MPVVGSSTNTPPPLSPDEVIPSVDVDASGFPRLVKVNWRKSPEKLLLGVSNPSCPAVTMPLTAFVPQEMALVLLPQYQPWPAISAPRVVPSPSTTSGWFTSLAPV